MLVRLLLPLCVWGMLAAPVSAADADYKVEALKEAPAGLSSEIAARIQTTGFRVSGKEGVVCDVWLAKQVARKPKFTASLEIKYPLVLGELVGAIRFPEADKPGDFRGQAIAPGTYTLRYGLQPNDGNHLGTSDVRDFLLACPPKTDVDPKRVEKLKDLFKLSAKAAGTTHPTVFLLLAPPEKPVDAAAVHVVAEKHLVVLSVNVTTKDGDKSTEQPLNLVVHGKAAE